MLYLSNIYLESWVSWLGGGFEKKTIKKRKQTEEKHGIMKRKKNEEYGQSQLTAVNIFGFTVYIKDYILFENTVWKNYFVPS